LSQRKLFLGHWARRKEVEWEAVPGLNVIAFLLRTQAWWNSMRPLPAVGGKRALHAVEPDEQDILMDIIARARIRLRTTPANGLTACRMRMHMPSVSSGTYGHYARSGHTLAAYAHRGPRAFASLSTASRVGRDRRSTWVVQCAAP
jgi:hypothetical protein